MRSDQESNPQSFGAPDDAPTTEQASQGTSQTLLIAKNRTDISVKINLTILVMEFPSFQLLTTKTLENTPDSYLSLSLP